MNRFRSPNSVISPPEPTTPTLPSTVVGLAKIDALRASFMDPLIFFLAPLFWNASHEFWVELRAWVGIGETRPAHQSKQDAGH